VELYLHSPNTLIKQETRFHGVGLNKHKILPLLLSAYKLALPRRILKILSHKSKGEGKFIPVLN
jgi:hypothetical protein